MGFVDASAILSPPGDWSATAEYRRLARIGFIEDLMPIRPRVSGSKRNGTAERIGSSKQVDHNIARHTPVDGFDNLTGMIKGGKGRGDAGATIAIGTSR